MNALFAASQITARVRQVKVMQTQFDETVSSGTAVLNDALTALQTTTDGKLDEMHALVYLIVDRRTIDAEGRETIGLGCIVDAPSVADGTFPALNEQFVFAAVAWMWWLTSSVTSLVAPTLAAMRKQPGE